MKHLYIFITFSLLVFPVSAQYTEVINSNRPGSSQGAFAVGKNVLQFEVGAAFSDLSHKNLDFSYLKELELRYNIRYGFFKEKLELVINGSYNQNRIVNNLENGTGIEEKVNFLNKQNLGFKYLIFDPYKNQKWHGTNLYSWKKNNKIRWIDLIPALSVYVGANYVPDDGYFYDDPFTSIKKGTSYELDDKTISFRGSIITQHHFIGRWVLVNNFIYDRISTQNVTLNTITTLTHNFTNPRWSSMIEYELIKNDKYSDTFIKAGLAHLYNKNYQFDISIGSNFKDTPNKLYGSLGLSTRLDWHRDIPPVDKELKKKQKQEKKTQKKNSKNEKKSVKQSNKNQKKSNKKEKKSLRKSKRKNK
tara:strand:- start:2670 stop:3752 length:1083 start_codon:yes stop_codon:yes gene_type:complete